jgi:hypothetical protein
MSRPRVQALFECDRGEFLPTVAAISPWSQDSLHGSAVAALMARALAVPDRTMARLTLEFLGPVPAAPLKLDIEPVSGGHRVQRQSAVLSAHGRAVAVGRSLSIRQCELDLPVEAMPQESPFDPMAAPPLDEPQEKVAGIVGWESFNSVAAVVKKLRMTDDPGRLYLWVRLLLPVVAGADVTGVELAAVAADHAGNDAGRYLPYGTFTFPNAELTVHLSRPPEGTWIGVRSDSVMQPTGAGLAVADLFDRGGRLGQSASALVIDRRP